MRAWWSKGEKGRAPLDHDVEMGAAEFEPAPLPQQYCLKQALAESVSAKITGQSTARLLSEQRIAHYVQ